MDDRSTRSTHIGRVRMIRQCAVMVGGLGTRLGSLTASTPKPLLPVAGRPFLAWLLRELTRFGIEETILLTGFRTDRIRAALPDIAAHIPVNMRITISEEPGPAGTGGALWHARSLLDKRFLVCNGDSLFAANLAPLLSRPLPESEAALGHLLLRHVADAARYGIVEAACGRVTSFREKTGESRPAWINAGIYAFDQRILAHLSETCSLERDVLAPLASAGCLNAMQANGYFIDIGIPDDLALAQTSLPRHVLRPALFLSLGCIIKNRHRRNEIASRPEWVDGALDVIRLATESGWHVFILCSQSLEGKDPKTHRQIAEQVQNAGGTIDDMRYCSDKPQQDSLTDLITAWEINPKTALIIGTNAQETQAGNAAAATTHLFPGGNILSFLQPLLTAPASR